MSRDNYTYYIRNLSDTSLFEETIKIVKCLERDRTSLSESSHWQNSYLYSEFWRRNKAKYYYEAHNQSLKQIGKDKSVISC